MYLLDSAGSGLLTWVDDPPIGPEIPAAAAIPDLPLLTSPGPDPSHLSALPMLPAPVQPITSGPSGTFAPKLFVEPPVTPAPSPLPAPGQSWLERQIAGLQNDIASGLAAFNDGEAAGRAVKGISVPGILTQVQEGAANVQKAAQLKDLLPLVVLLIGVAVGKPALGLLAGAALYVVSQETAAAPVA